MAIEIESASTKTRNDPPMDDDEDYELSIWSGIAPIKTQYLYPEPDSRLREEIEVPESLQKLMSNY